MSNVGAELSKLAEPWNFPADILDDMLQDRLVVGIENYSVQQRLLAQSSVNIHLSPKLAVIMEMVAN